MYCINPDCPCPDQPGESEHCQHCQTPLLLQHGQYVAIHPIGTHQSSATRVFRGIERETQEQKVIKVLIEPSGKRIRLLEREYDALSLLDLPGRIPLADLDGYFTVTPPDQLPLHCLVLEYLEGDNLATWLEEHGPLKSETQAIAWLRQLAEILSVVHSQRYFHRDIKPSNILLRPDGTLALIDFGAVRRVTETYLIKLQMAEFPSHAYSVTAIGSAGYDPREQIRGRAVPQSDFYALGRTMVHLLTGIHPLNLETDGTERLQWRNHAPQVSGPFAELLDRLMAARWEERPATPEAILSQLDALPHKIRRSRCLRSWQFKVSATLMGLGAMIGVGWEVQTWALNQRLATAERYFSHGTQDQLAGRLESARRNYEQGLRHNPNSDEVLNNLALLCQQQGNLTCAIDYYHQSLQLKDSVSTRYNLASLYDEQGDDEQAETLYRQVIQAGVSLSVDATNNLARIKNRQGQFTEARNLVKAALVQTSDPISVAALRKNLGWAEFQLNRLEVASQELQRSLSLKRRGDTLCLLAQVQERQQSPQARQTLQQCLLSEDDSTQLPEVQQWRSEFLKRLLS